VEGKVGVETEGSESARSGPEREPKKKLEQEKLEREREEECDKKLERERHEEERRKIAERDMREEEEKKRVERLENERLEKERGLELERLTKERMEHERQEKQRFDMERLARERVDQERLGNLQQEMEVSRAATAERAAQEWEARLRFGRNPDVPYTPPLSSISPSNNPFFPPQRPILPNNNSSHGSLTATSTGGSHNMPQHDTERIQRYHGELARATAEERAAHEWEAFLRFGRNPAVPYTPPLTPTFSSNNPFLQPQRPAFPVINSPHGSFTITSVGGDQKTTDNSQHITNSNSGNTTTISTINSHNDSSVRISRRMACFLHESRSIPNILHMSFIASRRNYR
jgi:hypothetical protein